jgi:hypothetical protein
VSSESLPSEFEVLRTNLMMKDDLNIEECVCRIRDHVEMISRKDDGVEEPRVMFTGFGRDDRPRRQDDRPRRTDNRPRRQDERSSKHQNKKSKFACHNCGDTGHYARDCDKPATFGSAAEKKEGGPRCYNCNGAGHMSYECKSRRRGTEGAYTAQASAETPRRRRDDETSHRVYVLHTDAERVPEHIRKGSWILDSGATGHFCNDERLFSELNTDVSINVLAADSSVMKSKGVGTVGVYSNVHYVPDLSCNLLSVSELMRHGFSSNFIDGIVEVRDSERELVMEGSESYGLFVVPMHAALLASTVPARKIDL